jgi:hypothetical protein
MPSAPRLVATLLLLAGARLASAQPSCNLNPTGPDRLIATVAQSGSDFDVGWKGTYHDFQVPQGARFDVCLDNCDLATDPLCDVRGYAFGQSAAGRTFAPPIPTDIGNNPVCIVTTFVEPFATGTANVQTGEIDVTANISANVHLTQDPLICPKCSGASVGATGTCVGGATPGAACTTQGVVNVQNASDNPYTVSRDCLPAAGLFASVAFPVVVRTSAVSSTTGGVCPGQTGDGDDCTNVCASGNCQGAGNGSGVSQNCCDGGLMMKRCFPVPVVRTGSVTSPPAPAFPDPAYPKVESGTLASAFCAPGAPGLIGAGVNSDVGLPGPAAFVLPVNVEWQLDPTPPSTTSTTTTTTTTPTAPSSTTTTLPGCTGPADCDDGDTCTDDRCTAGTCANPPIPGPAGVACRIGTAKQPPECATLDAKLAQALSAALSKARSSVSGLAGATPKRAKKLEKAADGALKRLNPRVNKAAKKRTIDDGCKGALLDLIANLRSQIGAL